MSQPPPPRWALAMLRIRTGVAGVGGEEGGEEDGEERDSARAASMESALRTSILVGGSWGQAAGSSGWRLCGW